MEAGLRRAVHPTVLGELVLVADAHALRGVYFPGHRVQPQRARQGTPVALGEDRLLAAAAAQLDEYLAGRRTAFDLPLAAPTASTFDARVWQVLDGIPLGATVTYGELAARLGNPRMAQAVGGAVGRNPLCLVVPCHRVVGAGGRITGYAGGEERKRWLLEHEAHLAGRVPLAPSSPRLA